jgi:hypothetical protein
LGTNTSGRASTQARAWMHRRASKRSSTSSLSAVSIGSVAMAELPPARRPTQPWRGRVVPWPMATISAALAALPSSTSTAPSRLDRLWHERTALIALVRHFG